MTLQSCYSSIDTPTPPKAKGVIKAHLQTHSLVCLGVSQCLAGAWKLWAQERPEHERETHEERGSACPKGP